jgi:hypothetical protein
MKRWFLIVALYSICALRCEAQFIGYTSQQSVTSIPFNNSTCTAAGSSVVTVPNIGQGAHFLTLTSSGSTQTLVYVLQGSYDGINFFDISDHGTNTQNSSAPTGVTGTGYYPVVGVRTLACTPGAATFTLKYSGISLTPGIPAGSNQTGQIIKNLALLSPANTALNTVAVHSPFGSSSGILSFVYTAAAGPSGSTLTVACGTNNAFLVNTFGPFTLQTTQSQLQLFPIAPSSCTWFAVFYTSGGASAASFSIDYAFSNLSASIDPCQSFNKSSAVITAAAAATTQIVALNATQALYVCGYQMSQVATAATLQWVYGTGASCGTGTTSLTGVMGVTASQPISYGGAGTVMKVPIGNALCLTTTGAGGTAAGIVSYVSVPW